MTIRARAALAALLLLAGCRDNAPARAGEARGELYLLTSLPILWGEEFGLDQAGSPVLSALEKDYKVKAVDLPSQVPDGALLLAAQPRALPAEELVALDHWVRAGGRLLLLADPMLEWPSKRPLGDPRRAPVAFPDTGLLAHWGLRLDAPEERGMRALQLGDADIQTISPGTLSGACDISRNGLAADCRIGKGRAKVIADADWLDLDPGATDGTNNRRVAALASQLALLSR